MKHAEGRGACWGINNNMHAVHNLFLSLIPSHLFFFCFPPSPPPSLDDVRAFNPHSTQCVRQRPPLQVRPCIYDNDPEPPPRLLGLQQQLFGCRRGCRRTVKKKV